MPHPDELQSYRQSARAVEAEKVLEEIMEKKTVCSNEYSIKYYCCLGGMIGLNKTRVKGVGIQLVPICKEGIVVMGICLRRFCLNMRVVGFVLSWARVRMVVMLR